MPAPVLIVEDDAGIRQTLSLLLEDECYRVYQAPDGRPVLARLRASPEGFVVLLDLQMPCMDGIQVLRALAAEPPLLARHAVIVMTAYRERMLPPALTTLLAERAIPILTKPFDIAVLLTLVCQAQARLRDAYPPP